MYGSGWSDELELDITIRGYSPPGISTDIVVSGNLRDIEGDGTRSIIGDPPRKCTPADVDKLLTLVSNQLRRAYGLEEKP